MPEADKTTVTLIATSWQALKRAENKGEKTIYFDKSTLLCDCIVTIVFASFFLEANLNYILDYMAANGMSNKQSEDFRGLKEKIKWFYKEYVPKNQKENNQKVYQDIEDKFSGFEKICEFRNDVVHGKLKSIKPYEDLHDLEPFVSDVGYLRDLTKKIVDWLYEIAKNRGCNIPRDKNYIDVIDNYIKKSP